MPASQPEPQSLLERLQELNLRIETARGRAAGAPVKLLPVTKGHGPAVVRQALDLGLRELGENYVQECRAKAAALQSPAPSWHLLGHLQRNKVAVAAQLFSQIESVDSLTLARALAARRAASAPLHALCEVDFTGIPQRHGFRDTDLLEAAEEIFSLGGLSVTGLMTVADPEQPQRCFEACRLLRDRLETRIGRPLPELSMGMSQDFEVAIAEGSTEVRIGTLIFGPRAARPA